MKPDCLKSNVVGEKSYSFALEIIHIARQREHSMIMNSHHSLSDAARASVPIILKKPDQV